MDKKVISKKVRTLRDCIEIERKRLKAQAKSDRVWWLDKSRSEWARTEFGDDLDGEINGETLRLQMETCQICGKDFPLDERFLRLEFSFCDEYDCEMNICLKCLSDLVKLTR